MPSLCNTSCCTVSSSMTCATLTTALEDFLANFESPLCNCSLLPAKYVRAALLQHTSVLLLPCLHDASHMLHIFGPDKALKNWSQRQSQVG